MVNFRAICEVSLLVLLVLFVTPQRLDGRVTEVCLQVLVWSGLSLHIIHVLLCKKCSLFLQERPSVLLKGFEPVCAIDGVLGVRPRVHLVKLGVILGKTR